MTLRGGLTKPLQSSAQVSLDLIASVKDLGQLHLRCQVIIERQLVNGLNIDLLGFFWNTAKCPMGPAAAGFGSSGFNGYID